MLHGWKEDSMLVKRIAAYPSIFNRLRASEILVGNCNFFLPHAFNAPVGVIPLDDLRFNFWWVSCRMTRLLWCKNIPEKLNSLSIGCTHVTYDRRQADRQITLAL